MEKKKIKPNIKIVDGVFGRRVYCNEINGLGMVIRRSLFRVSYSNKLRKHLIKLFTLSLGRESLRAIADELEKLDKEME